MKKIIMILLAVMSMAMFIGCDTLTDIEQENVKTYLGISDGLSAYEVATANGFEGTEEEWLDSLRGEAGIDGIDGLEGLSAYQLWVLAGNDGTEEDFLDSLRGICTTCEEPEPVIASDTNISMVFITKIAGLSNIKIGHLRDGSVVELEDAVVVDNNGTLTMEASLEVLEGGSHILGIQFDKGD